MNPAGKKYIHWKITTTDKGLTAMSNVRSNQYHHHHHQQQQQQQQR